MTMFSSLAHVSTTAVQNALRCSTSCSTANLRSMPYAYLAIETCSRIAGFRGGCLGCHGSKFSVTETPKLPGTILFSPRAPMSRRYRVVALRPDALKQLRSHMARRRKNRACSRFAIATSFTDNEGRWTRVLSTLNVECDRVLAPFERSNLVGEILELISRQ